MKQRLAILGMEFNRKSVVMHFETALLSALLEHKACKKVAK